MVRLAERQLCSASVRPPSVSSASGNDLYLWELPPEQQLPASFGPGDVEACEGGWANDGYAWSWADVTGVVGVFDGEPREDFEDQWSGN